MTSDAWLATSPNPRSIFEDLQKSQDVRMIRRLAANGERLLRLLRRLRRPSAPSGVAVPLHDRSGSSPLASPRPLSLLIHVVYIYIYNLYSYLVNIGILIMSSLLLFLDYCVYPPSGALWMLISLRSICSSWMRSLGQEHGAPARKGVSRGR